MSEKQDKNTFEPSAKDKEKKLKNEAQTYLDMYMAGTEELPEDKQLEHLKVGFKTMYSENNKEKKELKEKLVIAEEKVQKLQAPKK